jgi:hypothetical protein
MSYRHVRIMNRLLAEDSTTRALAARLTRRYVLAYELTAGPTGMTIWWQMLFDPVAGVSFALSQPESPADLTMIGDWHEAMQDFAAMCDGRKDVVLRLKPVGDEGIMTAIAEVFAAAQKAAAVPATIPDV